MKTFHDKKGRNISTLETDDGNIWTHGVLLSSNPNRKWIAYIKDKKTYDHMIRILKVRETDLEARQWKDVGEVNISGGRPKHVRSFKYRLDFYAYARLSMAAHIYEINIEEGIK